MGCGDTFYFDPGSRMCRSCYDVCDRNVDPNLDRDCKEFCIGMYNEMILADADSQTPMRGTESWIPPVWAIVLLAVSLIFIAVAVIVVIICCRPGRGLQGLKDYIEGSCCRFHKELNQDGHMSANRNMDRQANANGNANGNAVRLRDEAASDADNRVNGRAMPASRSAAEKRQTVNAAIRYEPVPQSRAQQPPFRHSGTDGTQQRDNVTVSLVEEFFVPGISGELSGSAQVSLHSDGFSADQPEHGLICSPEDNDGPTCLVMN